MGNQHKGEVSFKAEGESYALRFSADAICDLEDALGQTINQIGQTMQNPATMRLSIIRTMFGAALKDVHPELDDAKVKKVFKGLSASEAINLVIEAFNKSFDDGKGGEPAPAGANPSKPGEPASGTGPGSVTTG